MIRLKSFVLFIWWLFFSVTVCAKTIFVDSMLPPPGFTPEHAIQHLRVMVVFMNQPVGFAHITIRDGLLQFYKSENLLLQLEGLKKEKKVLSVLSQSFPLNIECAPKGSAIPSFCEQLKHQPAYVIYDPQEEKVHLFFNAEFFKKPKSNESLDFIPNSSADWSYINKMGATGAFSTEEPFSLSQIYSTLPNYYNFYSNNILAYRNSSLIANLSQNNGLNDGQRFQIQNLYAQEILRDKVYSGGYIINPNSPFFQTQIIAGVGVQTTLATLKNRDSVLATPLVIFVPQASQVSIFKNEQLIFSQYIPAGYQTINTNGFPEGSYELLIKIGANNVINRVFTKSLSLPPMQAPQFYLLGGYLTNGMIFNGNDYTFLPKTLNIPVLQAGLNKRVSERSAFFGDLLLQSNQALFDFGSTLYLGNSFIRTAGLMTTRNDYGIYTMLNT